MKKRTFLKAALWSLCLYLVATWNLEAQTHKAPVPMYRDPLTDGAADPVMIWNEPEQCWWMLYTQRRANLELADVAYCYGNSIAIAESRDNGASWYYRGTLDLAFEPGHNTFWAPEIIYHEGTYHLFVAYIRGVRNHWGGKADLIHYTSQDLWKWNYQGKLNVGSDKIIDISLFQMKNGLWRAWYKDENAGAHIFFADSKDLKNWTIGQQASLGDASCEGPKIFQFQGYYWMITDEWHGFRLYRSHDLEHWEQQGILVGDASNRPDDKPSGAHGDVVVVGDKAYIIYFTHPGRSNHHESPLNEIGNQSYQHRRSSIQCAELVFRNGTLECDRSDSFDFYLPNQSFK